MMIKTKFIFIPLFLLLINSNTALGTTACHHILIPFKVRPDFRREWGVKLLYDNDKTFQTPEYKNDIEWASKPGTVSFYKSAPFKTEYTKIYEDYERRFSNSDPYMPEILRFTNSGTEANNMLYEFAEYAVFKRTGKKAKRANLLYFGHPYGGTFGRIAEIGVRYITDSNIEKQLHIPTPYSKELNPQDPIEIKELEKIEAKALKFIRHQVSKKSLEIGGIFFEPISVTEGLRFFRPQFLLKLRELADELQVPIMADEIFTGGGRTGKFWAIANYAVDFRPDIFTFGKGLGVSGLAYFIQRVPKIDENGEAWMRNRWEWPAWERNSYNNNGYTYPETVLDNTSRVHPLALIQSLHILNRIIKDQLPARAQQVGQYALDKIKKKAESLGFGNEVHGIGLLFHVGPHTDSLVGKDRIEHYLGRWAPPLTVEKEDFDVLLNH